MFVSLIMNFLLFIFIFLPFMKGFSCMEKTTTAPHDLVATTSPTLLSLSVPFTEDGLKVIAVEYFRPSAEAGDTLAVYAAVIQLADRIICRPVHLVSSSIQQKLNDYVISQVLA